LHTTVNAVRIPITGYKPCIERVQALADISHSALCCHSSETRAPIANPPNSCAQVEGTTYHSPNLHPVRAVVRELWRGTDTQTHKRPWAIYIRLGYTSREM